MDPFTLSLIAGIPRAATGLGQTVASFAQTPPTRPEFQIPGAATAALKNAEVQASQTRLPGQAAIEGRLDRNTANELSMIERLGSSPTGNINAASRAYGQQQDSETGLGIAAANMQRENQGILRNEQHQYANWENMKNQWDTYDPYKSKMAQISALKGAGLSNLGGGLQDMLGTMANFAFAKGLNPTMGEGAKSVSLPENANNPTLTEAQSIVGGDQEIAPNRTPEQKRLMELLYLIH